MVVNCSFSWAKPKYISQIKNANCDESCETNIKEVDVEHTDVETDTETDTNQLLVFT